MNSFCQLENVSNRIIRNKTTYKLAKNMENQHKLDDMIFDSYFHKACATLACNPQTNPILPSYISNPFTHSGIKIAAANIDLQSFFKPLFDARRATEKKAPTLGFAFDGVWCGYYEENMEYKDDYLMSFLYENMKNNEAMFIYLDFENYNVIENEKKNKNTSVSVHHSTCFMMLPNKETNRYSMYYFNPHGQYMLDVRVYNYYLTQYRQVELELPLPIDMFIMGTFVESLNNELNKYYCDWKFTDYSPTRWHNYLGANLQISDSKGICYVFSFIMWYHLHKEYYESHNVNGMRIKNYRSLLESGNFELMVYIIFSKYDENLVDLMNFYTITPKYAFDEQFRNHYEVVLSETGENFMDQLFINMVYFICQKPIETSVC